MLDQLILAAQLALENINSNEVKSVLDKVYTRNVSDQSEQTNSMISHGSINALLVRE